MDKQKQIEEMARIIAFDLCPSRNSHIRLWGGEAQCYSDNNFAECTQIKNVVDKLYNAGYRKIPEGSAVLSKEENEKWLDFLEMNITKARKQAVKEVIERVKKSEYIKSIADDGYIVSYVELCQAIDKIAKEMGVEL